MNVTETLIALLETLGYPVFLRGTINPDDEIPASFFTIWCQRAPERSFYDDGANAALWEYAVHFYSTNPYIMETTAESARGLLKSRGWTTNGRPIDATSELPAYTGLYFAASYFQNYD